MCRFRKNNKHTLFLAIGVISISLFLVSMLCQNNWGSFAGKSESITVAYSPFESITLFWVAENQNFFIQNGLNVISLKYDTGAGALNGILNGEADIAVGANEFPLTLRALDNEKIRTIGSISKSEFIYIVGRADHGIENVSDLNGKRIGTTFGTIAHFYLGRFLDLNGINIQDVTIIDLKTPIEWVSAVVNGSVDAVATAQPYANSAKDSLGANAVVWSIQSGQPMYTQAISTEEWITEHPELCSRFLESLHQAESFASNHPAEVKEIIKNQMNFSDAYLETVLDQNQFSLSLDQSLILAMEGEARWLISNNLTKQTVVPDFTNFIYFESLNSVKPEAVNIIR
jgi:sulfonate transport system substrate-binding protein